MDLIKLLRTCLDICFDRKFSKFWSVDFLVDLADVLVAYTCTRSMENLCCNCFAGNIVSPFSWIHLPVTGFIEEADDLSLDYLDYVLY